MLLNQLQLLGIFLNTFHYDNIGIYQFFTIIQIKKKFLSFVSIKIGNQLMKRILIKENTINILFTHGQSGFLNPTFKNQYFHLFYHQLILIKRTINTTISFLTLFTSACNFILLPIFTHT
ncbi:unnamed protein product [Paramecium primaurelia]|uniref:Transmembrane protein n=1 Tax=Paramecium primaurelia TaxID=5886 RepID=A0A8S1NP49_PARPR|nr:unnamed protein product [Paramecium primaurelia]